MRAAIHGFRKIILYLLTISALTYGLHEAIAILREIDKDKATQAAIIVGGFFGAIPTIFGMLMSAFKEGYRRDATVEVAKIPGVPTP